MALAGSIAVVTRQQAPAVDAAVAQLKKTNALVTDVVVLSVAAGASVAQTVAAASSAGSFDAVITFNEETAMLSTELDALAPVVKAGGALHVYIADASEDKKSSILMALMIGGFVEAADSDATDGAAFFPEFTNARCFSSKKPAFESGAALSLSLGKKTTTTAQPLKKWTVLADEFDNADDDDEIIDEDTLLDDTDEVLQAAKNDCAPGVGGKKRACKNCTCGLKDEEDQPVVSDKDLEQMVSGCGNCFKGDAFRCGSCPFLGKPAFKPGMEKVLLNLDDADDF
ncbi:Anamorsin isoform x1 [Globisporangium polare]